MTPLLTCIYSLEELPSLSKKIFNFIAINNIKIIYLYGELGSGKTTFFKSIMESISSDLLITSPTYSYVNEYEINDQYIWHFDLYRIENKDELFDLGLIDYFSRHDGIAFIEWPEKIEHLIDKAYHKLILKFHYIENQKERALVIYKGY